MDDQRFIELARIPVRIGPSRTEGALAPMFDEDEIMLRADVPSGTSAPIGVNVDALVIIDALQDGTVFDVEVLVPRSAWHTRGELPKRPAAIEEGSLVIADPGPSIEVYQLRPRFLTGDQNQLHIQLEPVDAETRWVALSGECFALLNGDFLAGFVGQVAR